MLTRALPVSCCVYVPADVISHAEKLKWSEHHLKNMLSSKMAATSQQLLDFDDSVLSFFWAFSSGTEVCMIALHLGALTHATGAR